MSYEPIVPQNQWPSSAAGTIQWQQLPPQEDVSYFATGDCCAVLDTAVADTGTGATNATNQSGTTGTQSFLTNKANVLNVTTQPPEKLERETAWSGQPKHAAPAAARETIPIGPTQALLSRRLAARRGR
jgi:hypothetical protein